VIDGWVYSGSPAPASVPAERIAAFDARLRSGHEHDVVRRWHESVRPSLAESIEHLRGQDLTAMPAPVLRAHIHALSDLLTAARERLSGDAARVEWDEHLHAARSAYALREDDVSFVNAAHGLMRYALREAGRRMTAQHSLLDPDLVFFLRRDELEDALAGRPRSDLIDCTASRRTAWQQYTPKPPEHVGTRPPPADPLPLSPEAQRVVDAATWYFSPQGAVDTPAHTDRELHGIAASPGRYRGAARIVSAERDFDRVQLGDVLICPTTNPAWTVLFASIGALVSDKGGVLSHPAIAAREFGIPAVVGVGRATDTFEDGQLVEVDGTTGLVRYEVRF
jgi:phosphohistidine swiveling domain-containing protein